MGGNCGCIRSVPHHASGVAEGNGERHVRRRIERGIGLGQATQRARARMCSRRSRPVVQTTLLARTVADDGGRQRIGNGLARRQAGGNRRQHLHRQGEQDQGQEFLQPCAHPPNRSFGCDLNTSPRPESRPVPPSGWPGTNFSKTVVRAPQADRTSGIRGSRPSRRIHRFLIFVICLRGKQPDHFVSCCYFEQSLPKMMTSEKS